MKTSHSINYSKSGFTLVEVMVAGTLCVLVIGMALGTFFAGLRTMCRDTARNATNGTMTDFLRNITTKSLSSTEFYLFPDYTALDGTVNLNTADPACNLSPLSLDAYGKNFARGDCLVLISRMTTDTTANIKSYRIYFRKTTSPNTQAPLWVYEPPPFADPGSTATPTALFNGINLTTLTKTSPYVKQLVDFAIGRQIPNSSNRYPIFSADTTCPSPAQADVSINMEVVNGQTTGRILSSSCSNYIIAPRK
jgi:hypothetical protein